MSKSRSTTKQKLIETATELIWRNSYGAVSVDEICRKAGVQKGSFYHFFPSKADLGLATIDAGMHQVLQSYKEIFSPNHAPVDRFKRLVEHLTAIQVQKQKELGHVCGCPMMTLGSELAGRETDIEAKIKEICATQLTFYQTTLQDLVRNGQIDKNTNIKTKAEEIYALIVGQLFLARIKNDLNFIKNNLKDAVIGLLRLKTKKLT